jgi:hypothetical protein
MDSSLELFQQIYFISICHVSLRSTRQAHLIDLDLYPSRMSAELPIIMRLPWFASVSRWLLVVYSRTAFTHLTFMTILHLVGIMQSSDFWKGAGIAQSV